LIDFQDKKLYETSSTLAYVEPSQPSISKERGREDVFQQGKPRLEILEVKPNQ